MRAIKLVAFVLCAGILLGACSKSTPAGPGGVTGNASLTVMVKGSIGGQVSPVSAPVEISGPTDLKQTADNTGKAMFANIPGGDYKVISSGSFGYQGTTSQTSVPGTGSTNYELVLNATTDLKFLQARANGQPIVSGATIPDPSDLEFDLQVMNAGTKVLVAQAFVIDASNNQLGSANEPPMAVVQGLQTVTIKVLGHRPCKYVPGPNGSGSYGACASRSTQILFLLRDYPNGGTTSSGQQIVDFVLNYPPKP